MKLYDGSILYLCIVTTILACASIVMIKEIRDWTVEQDQLAQERAERKGWQPPAIQHVEGCALWDEIRHACEDD